MSYTLTHNYLCIS